MGLYYAKDSTTGVKIAHNAEQLLLSNVEGGLFHELALRRIRTLLPEDDIGTTQLVANPDIASLVQEDCFVVVSGVKRLKEKMSFDGWVLANGATYAKEDFPAAYDLYKSSASAMTFNVPDIQSFIKLDSNAGGMKHVNWTHPIAKHAHNLPSHLTMSSTKTFPAALSVIESTGHSNINASKTIDGIIVPALCPGIRPTEAATYDFSKDPVQSGISPYGIDLELSSNVLMPETTETTGRASEAYPTHMLLPALVYIGRRLYDELDA